MLLWRSVMRMVPLSHSREKVRRSRSPRRSISRSCQRPFAVQLAGHGRSVALASVLLHDDWAPPFQTNTAGRCSLARGALTPLLGWRRLVRGFLAPCLERYAHTGLLEGLRPAWTTEYIWGLWLPVWTDVLGMVTPVKNQWLFSCWKVFFPFERCQGRVSSHFCTIPLAYVQRRAAWWESLRMVSCSGCWTTPSHSPRRTSHRCKHAVSAGTGAASSCTVAIPKRVRGAVCHAWAVQSLPHCFAERGCVLEAELVEFSFWRPCLQGQNP